MHTLDGIPQDTSHPIHEILLGADAATDDLAKALRSYRLATQRPRKRSCWAFVVTWLWSARRAAVCEGALRRNTPEHDAVTECLRDASARLHRCQADADLRV